MTQPFPHLFQPIEVGAKTLKHRLNFGAHTANMSEGGLPMDRHLGCYRERARGGAAMIVVEPVPAHRTGVLTRGNFRACDDAVIPHFRRALPTVERLPGIERGHVWAVEEVIGKAARLGSRVLLLDDTGNWRGAGTAWAMAEQGHGVTMLTPDSMVGREILRTGSEFPMRKRLRGLGIEFVADAAVKE